LRQAWLSVVADLALLQPILLGQSNRTQLAPIHEIPAAVGAPDSTGRYQFENHTVVLSYCALE